MLVIGLTGGIASGKSTVSGLLKSYNIPVIDLDELAREVVQPGSAALAAILRRFPDDPDLVHPSSRALNRARLGEIVFADPTQRRWLDALLHPLIRRLMALKVLKLWLTGAKICVVDAPLLIETGLWKFCGKVVVVYCSEELQLQRLKSRNSLSRSAAKDRISSQLPLKAKLAYADYIIDNSGLLPDLERQVERLVWKFEKSTNRLVWLLNWLLPPIGVLNALLTIIWRVWVKPISRSHRRRSRSSSAANSVESSDIYSSHD